MKLFRTLISYEEAVGIVLSHAPRLGHEEIRFNEALGRILAEDIRSPIDSPPFDRAAMDGYAIRGEDSFGASPRAPVLLKIRRGRPGAGETEPGLEVHAGEGIPIATGMPVPKGSNAVVMLEYTRERGDTLEIYRPLAPGRNVSFHGEDVKAGEVVLHAGRRLRAHDIGMLAALFQRTVQVYKRATIGILSTGDELIDPLADTAAGEQSPAKQKIADSNSYMMAALTQTIANPHRIGIVRDDYETITAAIRSALGGACDGLLVTGGSSVGSRDFLSDAVEGLGELIFHGVAMRPGEPTGFGIINTKPVFVLPGYPVAAIAAFELLVRPFLYALHDVAEERRRLFAIAQKDIPSTVGRTDFVRVKLQQAAEGRYFAEPVRVSGAGILSSMTKSDGFVIIPENKEGIATGETVAVTLYE